TGTAVNTSPAQRHCGRVGRLLGGRALDLVDGGVQRFVRAQEVQRRHAISEAQSAAADHDPNGHAALGYDGRQAGLVDDTIRRGHAALERRTASCASLASANVPMLRSHESKLSNPIGPRGKMAPT